MADWLDHRIVTFDPAVQQRLTRFIRQQFAPEDDVLQTVRRNAQQQGLPEIQIRPEEGQMLLFLAALIGARRILEIGTLAGYSGIWLARSLPETGSLITLEQDPAHARLARRHFSLAGLDDRVTVLEAPAQETLARLDGEDPFDLVFIDADKDAYPLYAAWALRNVRTGGLIAVHNALRGGHLADEPPDPPTRAVRETLELFAQHPRLLGTLIPVGDGLAVALVQ